MGGPNCVDKKVRPHGFYKNPIPGFRPVLGTFWAALRAVLYSCALYVYVTCIHSRGTPLLSLVRCAYTIYTMSESTCTWQYACMHVFSASHVYAHPKHTCPTMGGGQRRRAPCMQAAFSQASISIITGYPHYQSHPSFLARHMC